MWASHDNVNTSGGQENVQRGRQTQDVRSSFSIPKTGPRAAKVGEVKRISCLHQTLNVHY